MDKFFLALKRLAPETIMLLSTRYLILRQIFYRQPIGRRQLGKHLELGERLIRNELGFLKEKRAIDVTPAGIYLTAYGESLLNEINEYVPFIFETQNLANKLKKIFGLPEVIVVPGDSETDYLAKKDIGRAAARYLKSVLTSGCIVSVTGGTTLAEMANAINQSIHMPDVLVVPARGGLGQEMEEQAGTIVARIAKAIGAQYRLLHVPDNLEESTVEILKKDAYVAESISTIKRSQVLLHGIGPVITMAQRRGLKPAEIQHLICKGAVGEALRYYFDKKGNIVYEVPGIGLEIKDLLNIKVIVAVAGGANKAQAISAVLSNRLHSALITDEGAAKEMIKGKEG
jgi:central glycolytic genes regulator